MLYSTVFFTIYDEYDEIFKLDDIVSFQWLKNSHCVGAAQLQLILNGKNSQKKILYTIEIEPKSFDEIQKESKIPETFFAKPLAFFKEVWYNITCCTGV